MSRKFQGWDRSSGIQSTPKLTNLMGFQCTQGGVHFSEGGYARIAVKVFNTLDVDVFYVGFHTDKFGRNH